MSIRKAAMRVARPFAKLIDHVNVRFGKPALSGDQYHEALSMLMPGDILLTRTKWRPTNIIFPGKWTHVLMCVGGEVLVEATMPVAKRTWLIDVWSGVSEVIIVRPKFMSEAQGVAAALAAQGFVGTPYDLSYASTLDELYCSELVYWSMLIANPKTPDLRESVMGEQSIKPDALANPEHFETLAVYN